MTKSNAKIRKLQTVWDPIEVNKTQIEKNS